MRLLETHLPQQACTSGPVRQAGRGPQAKRLAIDGGMIASRHIYGRKVSCAPPGKQVETGLNQSPQSRRIPRKDRNERFLLLLPRQLGPGTPRFKYPDVRRALPIFVERSPSTLIVVNFTPTTEPPATRMTNSSDEPPKDPAPTDGEQRDDKQDGSSGSEGEDKSISPRHIPMADRVSLVSWGAGSAPSFPSIDSDNETVHCRKPDFSFSEQDDSDSAVGTMMFVTETLHTEAVKGRVKLKALFAADPPLRRCGRVFTIPLKNTVAHITERWLTNCCRISFAERSGKLLSNPDSSLKEAASDKKDYSKSKIGLQTKIKDLQHALFVLTTQGRLHLAPIGHDVQNVLDIGTGTGIWSIEFAQEFPGCRVTGTDLSPIQPQYVPPNCQFEIDDAEDEWAFSTPFDYIHGRALLSCFSDPASVIREAYKSLAPGGWLELQDGCFPMEYAASEAHPAPPGDCALRQWNDLCLQGAAKAGRPWTNARHYKRWMEETGFVDVAEKKFYWPMNPWPRGAYYKSIGSFFMEDMLSGVDGISFKVLKGLGWGMEEIQILLARVRKDMMDPRIMAYLNIVFVYGRKPKEGEATA
ncbi:hypothetical protein MKZ38_008879 [Zalerion maritima]|uniref:S-adenosyl-L-methionine-dependent methyltransferase n=1 Tax=Zalerion maritima TaxID=339359 RepID=A0AAD5WVY9_9PEZI|nr:hypothetical protein MKZ38_008879 [Zalerion maritima]